MINLTLPDINGLTAEEAVKKLEEYLYELTDQVKNEMNLLTDATMSGDLAAEVRSLQMSVERINANLTDGLTGAVKKNAVIGAVNASSESAKIASNRITLKGIDTGGGFTVSSGGVPDIEITSAFRYMAEDYTAQDVTDLQDIIANDGYDAKYDFLKRGKNTGFDMSILNTLVVDVQDVDLARTLDIDSAGTMALAVSVNGTVYDCFTAEVDGVRNRFLMLYDDQDDDWFIVDAHALKALLS